MLAVLSFSGNIFAGDNKSIVLATTTSVRDSGLMDYLLPTFQEDTGYSVDMVAVGTGRALQMGEDGEADVLLVHAKASELKFMSEGHGTKRRELFYNYFVVVGPRNGVEAGSAKDLLNSINREGLSFISRGDDSGTHSKEKELWETAGYEYDEISGQDNSEWYLSLGQGMGDTLRTASEKGAYVLVNLQDKKQDLSKRT